MSEACDHQFQYQGVVYVHSDWPLPGSGAKARYYSDCYFCTRCLERQYRTLGVEDNSYERVRFNAVADPKAPAHV